MSQIKAEFVELYRFLEDEITNKAAERFQTEVANETRIVNVSKKALLESLNSTISEVEEKHKEAMKFWQKTVKIYTQYITENPGSTQMKVPDPAPKMPAIVEDVKGYIKLFKSLSADELKLELTFLKEIFQVSTRAISEATSIRNTYMQATTGSAFFANAVNSKY